ncbi:MAG TPA: glutamine synthetase family protein [Pseudonocardiaceae bacterium]|nr:glutamine synthetase family protein [Pseudonocardiaceae bacterium]
MQRQLAEQDVRAVAVTYVDNVGITRVKGVPLATLDSAAAWGVGISPVFDSFLFNDIAITGKFAPGAVGDLRLHPDLDRITVLAAQPGWAWAPGERYDQRGERHPFDQRALTGKAVAALAEAGYTARAAIEIEWVLGQQADGDEFVPAVHGPAYGMARLVERSDYLREVLTALAAQNVEVVQIHPEYAPGQLELSVAAEDPVGAADTYVLVRETIRAVSQRNGLRVSFSPKVLPEGVGNGGHVHLSIAKDGQNLFAGGPGRFGMTETAESFTAGILGRLPALLVVGAPSTASYLRLIPQHWAGAYAAWGLENRETALRLVTGPVGSQQSAANIEIKCFDQTANPYLAMAGLLFAGLAGIGEQAGLAEPIDVDPATLGTKELLRHGIRPLPASLGEAVAAFEADQTLFEAFGEPLATTLVDLRKAEIEHFATATAEEVTAALRWVH